MPDAAGQPPIASSSPPGPGGPAAGHGAGAGPPPLPRPPLHVMFPGSAAIVLAVLVFYLLTVVLGGPDEPSLRRLGAVRHDLALEEGEYYRFFCAAFLHGGLLHLTLNGLALIQLAPLVEMLWGTHRMLAVYLLSAVGGTVLSAVFQPLPSVGASGAILGLAGLLLGATWVAREPFRSRLRMVLGQRLLFAVVLTFVLGVSLQVFWLPIVDNYGHLGGLLVGLGASALLREPEAPAGRPARALAWGAGSLCLAAFAWMALAGRPVDQVDDLLKVHARLQREAPAHPHARDLTAALAGALSQAGRHDDARAVLLRRLAAAPDDVEAMARLAASFRLHGDVPPDVLGAVRGMAERAGRADLDLPPLERAHLRLTTAELHALAGDADAARAAEEEALALLEPAAADEDPLVLNALAWLLLTRHDPALRDPARAEALSRRAVDALEAPLRALRRDDAQLAAALDTLAEALAQLGRPGDALAFQRRAALLARRAGAQGDPLLEYTRRLERLEAAAGARQ
ncbi:MAG: rhomboid family intramembrane serine protease [Planctomycetes bacterium]|nr:rhomboid family intramembrane serine protease [Planctomycetota bacterium]